MLAEHPDGQWSWTETLDTKALVRVRYRATDHHAPMSDTLPIGEIWRLVDAGLIIDELSAPARCMSYISGSVYQAPEGTDYWTMLSDTTGAAGAAASRHVEEGASVSERLRTVVLRSANEHDRHRIIEASEASGARDIFAAACTMHLLAAPTTRGWRREMPLLTWRVWKWQGNELVIVATSSDDLEEPLHRLGTAVATELSLEEFGSTKRKHLSAQQWDQRVDFSIDDPQAETPKGVRSLGAVETEWTDRGSGRIGPNRDLIVSAETRESVANAASRHVDTGSAWPSEELESDVEAIAASLSLTERELHCLVLLEAGYSRTEIAQQVGASLRTVGRDLERAGAQLLLRCRG